MAGACASTRSSKRFTSSAAGEGRALYERSCQRCHALYMPSLYDPGEWDFFVRKYGRKARLTQPQRESVLDYLVRNARGT
ncbi:MAG: c-type cytochrome [Planctomycetota bacterium]